MVKTAHPTACSVAGINWVWRAFAALERTTGGQSDRARDKVAPNYPSCHSMTQMKASGLITRYRLHARTEESHVPAMVDKLNSYTDSLIVARFGERQSGQTVSFHPRNWIFRFNLRIFPKPDVLTAAAQQNRPNRLLVSRERGVN